LEVEIVEGDLSQADTLASAIEGCEAVIHSAAFIHIGWQKLALSRQVNVEGTKSIIEACLKHQARLIHISTVDTLPAAVSKDQPIDERGLGGVPKTPCAYVISKTEAEQAVRLAIQQRGLEAVILHPGFMLGPYDWKPSSGRMFLEVNKAPIVAAPPGGCSLCDARDVATAVVNSVQQGVPGENYILAGENLSYQELWTRMLQTSGRRRRVFRLGPGIRWLGKSLDLANRTLPIREGDVNGAAIAMGGLNHFYDSGKALRQFGYQTRITNQTLSDAWAWLSGK
jgi:dihydroflavonol-4-reductase